MTDAQASAVLATAVTSLANALSVAMRQAGENFSVEIYLNGEKIEIACGHTGDDIWRAVVQAARRSPAWRAS